MDRPKTRGQIVDVGCQIDADAQRCAGSFNETIRTSLVQGPENTVQTYIWSTYKQIGLSPTLYALMSLLILLSMVLVVIYLLAGVRGGRLAKAMAAESPPEPRPLAVSPPDSRIPPEKA